MVCLSELVDSTRELSAERAQLVAEVRTHFDLIWGTKIPAQMRYVHLLKQSLDELAEVRDWLRRNLCGQVLVDLGCGLESSRKVMVRIAREFGVIGYVGVDYSPGEFPEFFPIDDQPTENQNEFPIFVRKGDMLQVATALHANQVNFVLNGIDIQIISKTNYRTARLGETVRATKPEGVVFGFNMAYGNGIPSGTSSLTEIYKQGNWDFVGFEKKG